MWVREQATKEELAFLTEECPSMKLISRGDGTILYANKEFREWSGYTLNELIQLGWIDLSVKDESLSADIAEVAMIERGEIQTFSVQKKYRKKDGSAQIGTLTVKRFPLIGAVAWYGCTWEPHKNGTAAAFTLALEHAAKNTKAVETMAAELQKLSAVSDEESFVVKGFRLAMKHPRTALLLVAMFFGVDGAKTIVELAQRLGYMPLPSVKSSETPTANSIQFEDTHNDVADNGSGPEHRDSIGDSSITTRDGHVVSVSDGPLSARERYSERPWERVRYVHRGFSGSVSSGDRGISVLPGGVPAANRPRKSVNEF